MNPHETAGDFHQRNGMDYSDAGQFNVYRIEDFKAITLPHNRRDFYKITLLKRGEGLLSYADKTIHVKDGALSFTNPMIPYAWEHLSDEKPAGYFCMFTEAFTNTQLNAESLSGSPLFRAGGNHVLFPDQRSGALLKDIFEHMLAEMQSAYINKYELLRSYVQIIIHEALKIEPAGDRSKPGVSSARIGALFLELLERQFPIASPRHTVRFKNAGEFAAQLSVHTNHLNRALKEATGKTTTELISQRILREARALLLHSNWDIAEIGYCLGFDHAPNFNIFFKRQTGQTPSQFRRQPVAIS
jgi:AraC family transcriptional activator of pobA